jgi:hypothetical protein
MCHVPEDSKVGNHPSDNLKPHLIIKIPHIEETVYYVTLYFVFYLKEAGCKGSYEVE